MATAPPTLPGMPTRPSRPPKPRRAQKPSRRGRGTPAPTRTWARASDSQTISGPSLIAERSSTTGNSPSRASRFVPAPMMNGSRPAAANVLPAADNPRHAQAPVPRWPGPRDAVMSALPAKETGSHASLPPSSQAGPTRVMVPAPRVSSTSPGCRISSRPLTMASMVWK